MISILNYYFIYTYRHDRCGGEVGFYIRNDTKFTIRNDLKIVSNSFEPMFIKVMNNHRPAIIGVIYLPPNTSPGTFIDLSNQIDMILSTKNICFLLGDFNIDILKYGRPLSHRLF